MVPLPLPPLTYRVPDGIALAPGDPVRVRVRRKLLSGVVVDLLDRLPDGLKFEIRELEGRCDEFPALHDETRRMLAWAADYYHYPAGEVLRTFLPPNPAPPKAVRFRLTTAGRLFLSSGKLPRGKIQRALVEKLLAGDVEAYHEERSALRRMVDAGHVEEFRILDEETDAPPAPTSIPHALTEKQGEAVEKISAALDKRAFEAFLLQGVTGSGKTEVYLRAAEHCLRLGRSVLVVVPEISLTPQLTARFRARLGENIAVLHSGQSDGERSRQWHLLNQGKLKVCVGARSATLAPVRDLGLVVIDEEHDGALKQEDHLKYNGRDLAVVRARNAGAAVVLGSATPSLESFHNASTGRYQHLLLPERPGGKPLPDVHVVDCSRGAATEGSISPYLRHAMGQAIAGGGQVMLLLNRRGFSSFLLCEGCGFVPECPNCSVSLTNYKGARQLKCHYCGHSAPAPESCGKCGHPKLAPGTLGTESLEAEVRGAFPDARVIRIDRESVERKGALESALAKIAAREVDVVIGTQIIAKGHDFPNISLVGVVNADSGFHLPDFRASERSFQLFTQMAGRAGRGEMPGRVIVQTYNPKHPSIVHSTRHDFRGFAEEELRFRREFAYPPYSRLARVLVTGMSADEAEDGANRVFHALSRLKLQPAVEIMGPAPAVLSKVQNRYRWNLLLKCEQAKSLHTLLDTLVAHADRLLPKRVTLQVDVDPVSLM